MSLKISNRATAKQLEMLQKLNYDGQGKYEAKNLTIEEASEIIDSLLEEQRLADQDRDPYDQSIY